MGQHMPWALLGALFFHVAVGESLARLHTHRIPTHREEPAALDMELVRIRPGNTEERITASHAPSNASDPPMQSPVASRNTSRAKSHVHEDHTHADHMDQHSSDPEGSGNRMLSMAPSASTSTYPALSATLGTTGTLHRGSGGANAARRAHIHCDEDAVHSLYPNDAKVAGVAEAFLRVRVTIDERGNMTEIATLNNPGFGFIRAARSALSAYCHAVPANDVLGRPITSTVEFNFHFIQD